MDTMDIMCATDFEEFYYEISELVVPEGEPVGVDVDSEGGAELVLFSNIYWSQQYE